MPPAPPDAPHPAAAACEEASRRGPLPRGFHALIAAQFCSALADHALLIVTIALLHERQMAPWLAPMLKFAFTLAYVVLAPWLGPLADSMPKARLMSCMNGVKLLGVAALLAGLHPVAAFALVGVGAAAYAPAKYGLVTELVAPRQLVAANAWIEVSVVGAVLLGTVAGGLLVAPAWLDGGARLLLAAPGVAAIGGPLELSVASLVVVYGAAAALNLAVPDSGRRYPPARGGTAGHLRDFVAAQRTLWRDPDGALSMAVTTLLWGAGATLQFIVLRWATEQLGLPFEQAAWLQGVVAIGVVAGAAAAGRWVPLAAAPHLLGCGVLLGLAMPLLATVHTLAPALPLLLAAGAVGALLVVPMNALLQHRGHLLLSAGRSIAVQGFNENAGVLVAVAVYAALVGSGLSIAALMSGFGSTVALAVTALMWRERRQRRRAPHPGGSPA